MIDKEIEQNRYDKRAKFFIEAGSFNHISKLSKYLKSPYISYFKLLERQNPSSKVLEIGAGMGENTHFLLDMSFKVTSTDISSKSVEVMRKKFSKYSNFSAEVADIEKLPFNNEIFDVVCSAGSLSYGDNNVVMDEIYRVLKKGGVLIAVDSLNNNPIYKVNRYIHYLKGNRSRSTLIRMPTINLIGKYTDEFGYTEVRYFGAITWLFPVLKFFLSEERITKFSNWIDKNFQIRKSAFKFTMMAVKK
jgi:ubiquinone/menaquinone biosynthesis C-methylase UbiE